MPEIEPEVQTLPTSVRRARVLETVRRRQFASVADLTAAFGVSEVTIRNDLDALAENGQIQRVRGGAVHGVTGSHEASYEEAQDTHAAEKALIGAAAATLVESGSTVLLDTGTTLAAVARAIAARADLDDVTVFTCGLRVALELEPAIPRLSVLLTGGTLHRLQHSLVNPFGTTILEQVHAHLAILGCNGVDPQAGVTNSSVAEAEIKRFLLKTARRRVLVADGSKVGEISLVHAYPVDDVDLLITDGAADPAILAAIREHGVEVRVVG